MSSLPPSPDRALLLRVHAIVALCVVSHTVLTGARVAASLAALHLGASAFQVGVLIALFALPPALTAVRTGRWVDRAGTRGPALAGMVTLCVGLALPLWRLAPWTLVLAATLIGAGYAVSLLALHSQLSRCEDVAVRTQGFARFSLGTAVSAGLGPLLAGHVWVWAGPSGAFTVLGCLAAVALAGAVVARRGLEQRVAGVARAAVAAMAWRDVLRDPGLRRVLWMELLIGVAWNANSFIVPVHGTAAGWSADQVGNALAAFGAAVLLARGGPHRWWQRWGNWNALRIAVGTSAVCFMLFPWADRWPLALGLEVLMGMGLGSTLPSMLALLHAQSPPGRHGEVLGLRLVLLNVTAILSPVVLGVAGLSLGVTRLLLPLGMGIAAGAAASRPPPLSAGDARETGRSG